MTRTLTVALIFLLFGTAALAQPVGVGDAEERPEETGPAAGEEGYFEAHYAPREFGHDNIFIGNEGERVETVLESRGTEYDRRVEYNYPGLEKIDCEGTLTLGGEQYEVSKRYLLLKDMLYSITYRLTLTGTRAEVRRHQNDLFELWRGEVKVTGTEPRSDTAESETEWRRTLRAADPPVAVFSSLSGPRVESGESAEWTLALELYDLPSARYVEDKMQQAEESPWRLNVEGEQKGSD